ncbi:hypothetical protein V1523DRAFT_142943 [Lipomyces doorenjongii]
MLQYCKFIEQPKLFWNNWYRPEFRNSNATRSIIRIRIDGYVTTTTNDIGAVLCFTISEYVYNETTMVRSHIRAMHGIEVEPGNARMGRPRRGATATVGAIETERRNERRRLGRLISQYVRNRVAARFVRDRLQVVMTSGLSTASIAATVVEALEPVCAYYPGFNSEIASAKASLLQCNHAQFNSKIQLSKHISDHHRSVTSICRQWRILPTGGSRGQRQVPMS